MLRYITTYLAIVTVLFSIAQDSGIATGTEDQLWIAEGEQIIAIDLQGGVVESRVELPRRYTLNPELGNGIVFLSMVSDRLMATLPIGDGMIYGQGIQLVDGTWVILERDLKLGPQWSLFAWSGKMGQRVELAAYSKDTQELPLKPIGELHNGTVLLERFEFGSTNEHQGLWKLDLGSQVLRAMDLGSDYSCVPLISEDRRTMVFTSWRGGDRDFLHGSSDAVWRIDLQTGRRECIYRSALSLKVLGWFGRADELRSGHDNVRAMVPVMKFPYGSGETHCISRTVTPLIGTACGTQCATSSSGHAGFAVDFDMAEGTTVLAGAGGEVIWASFGYTGSGAGGYGNCVKILHSDNTIGYYAHLNAIGVSVGDIVSQGCVLGKSGYTGCATGPHLHWDVHDAADMNRLTFTVQDCSNQIPRGQYNATSTNAQSNCTSTFNLPCGSAVAISNGVPYTSTTQFSSSKVYDYNCNTWTESGPEKVHSYVHSGGDLTASLANVPAGVDLDVFVLSSCTSSSCVAAPGSTSVTVAGLVAGTYYIVVEGADVSNTLHACSTGSHRGNFGSYTLTVSSTGGPINPCANIAAISGCGGANSQTYTGGGTGAWATFCGFPTPGTEKVYSFVAPSTGTYSLQVTTATGGYVDYLWKSGSCGSTGWNCIQPVNTTGQYGSMNWTAGTTYYLLLDDENSSTGTHTFYVNCPGCSQPNNDGCNGSFNAVALTFGSTSCNPIPASSCGATSSGFSSCVGTQDDDVFFSFVPTSTSATVTVVSSAGYNAAFQVLNGPCGSGMTEVIGGCVDNTSNGGTETAQLTNLSIGTTYFIRVWHTGSAWGTTGGFTICVYGTNPLLPDLDITTGSATPTVVLAGDDVDVAHTIVNSGSTTITIATETAVFLVPFASGCPTNLPGSGFIEDNTLTATEIGDGIDTENPSVTIPGATAPGVYYLVLVADYLNDLTEADESNNIYCVEITVNGQLPDLVVSNVSLNYDEVCPGQFVQASFTVMNTGGAGGVINITQSGFWVIPVNDGCPNEIPIPIGTYVDDLNLFPSDMTDDVELVQAPVILPLLPDGDYLLAIVVDHDTDQPELDDEVNNIECVPFTVSTAAQPVAAIIAGDLEVCSGESTALTITNYDFIYQTYLWSTGSTNEWISVSTPGTYSVLVSGNGNCSESVLTEVTVTELTIDTDGDGIPDCSDGCPSVPGQIGSACNDGNACTTNDVLNASCLCAGTPDNTDADGDGLADCIDPCPALANLENGDPCDDGNSSTGSDVVTNCICAGTLLDDDCEGVPGGPAQPGAACDDQSACTTNDLYDANCNCLGTPVDPDDGNGCTTDSCNPLLGVINTPIDPDDGDACTLDSCDPITGVSNVFQDADGDGTCDANDLCPGGPEPGTACDDGNAGTGPDTIGLNCLCSGPLLGADCEGVPGGSAIPGTACDDLSVCTTNDLYDANCNCVGTPLGDSDNDGLCDLIDPCPTLANVEPGEVCSDGNACTINDQINASCTCVGTLVGDADGDGLCDLIDPCPTLANIQPGDTCDDANVLTEGETWDAGCLCGGGVAVDCEGIEGGTALPGEPCDDGNPNTSGEVYAPDCDCTIITSVPDPPSVDAWFTIQPNPSNGMFQVTSTGSTTNAIDILVFDALGQMVSAPVILTGSQPQRLDLQQQADGIYFLRATSGSEIHVLELVIQR